MKNAIIILLLLLSASFASAQKVDFDKKTGTVTVDGVACLKYESDPNNVTYSTLDGTEIMVLKFIRPLGVLHTQVVFLESGDQFTSHTYIFSKKNLVEKLLKSNTLVDCKLVPEKVRSFCIKNDEP